MKAPTNSLKFREPPSGAEAEQFQNDVLTKRYRIFLILKFVFVDFLDKLVCEMAFGWINWTVQFIFRKFRLQQFDYVFRINTISERAKVRKYQ